MKDRAIRPFTGWHMFAILVAFFGVVISVNVVMAVFAARTFGGTVVENSYVASQEFNGWLKQARAQEKLGWKTDVALDPSRHLTIGVTASGGPLGGARVEAIARHPLGRAPDIHLALREATAGHYIADRAVPAGRWLIHLTIRRGSDQARLIETVL